MGAQNPLFYADFISERIYQKKCAGKKSHQKTVLSRDLRFLEKQFFWIVFWFIFL